MSGRDQTYRIEPGQRLDGEISVPGDKSISHRAVMLGGIARGTTKVAGFLESADCKASLAALEAMGVTCRRQSDGALEIDGCGPSGLVPPAGPLDLGNSGTAMRLFMGLLAGQGTPAVLTGDASLSLRPMERVAEPLRAMGATIETEAGTPPVRIAGGSGLSGIEYTLPVPSAQIKSALLLAGLGARGRTEITSPGPSRDHTERMLRAMGVPLSVSDDGLKVGLEGPAALHAIDVRVPGDLSSAAFFIIGACIGARAPVVLRRVGINPTRTGILSILELMGARIEIVNETTFGDEPVADLRVHPGELVGTKIPAALVPLAIDELPVVFVAAAAASGKTVVTGASELRVKESDRLHAMAQALSAVGVAVEETARQRGRSSHRDVFCRCRSGQRGADCDSRHGAGGDLVPEFCRSRPGRRPEHQRVRGLSPMQGEAPVVAIDGPSGSGKGTIAEALARHLGWHRLDSGALYRSVGLAAERKGIAVEDVEGLAEMTRGLDLSFEEGARGLVVKLDGRDVTEAIRSEAASRAASEVAVLPAVRTALLERQRAFAIEPGLVADGRDMGTVVFPEAVLKVFLTASPEERARRRHNQLNEKGIGVSLRDLSEAIAERDERDASRAAAPLKPAADAIVLDSTELSPDKVVQRVLDWLRDRGISAKPTK
jgi:3-phosphoshikimate 1-carboxyvinyltransferase